MQGPLDRDVRRPQQRWFHPRHAEGGRRKGTEVLQGPQGQTGFYRQSSASRSRGRITHTWTSVPTLGCAPTSRAPPSIPHPLNTAVQLSGGHQHTSPRTAAAGGVHPPHHPRESRSTALCRRPRTGRHAPTATAGRPGLPAPPPDPIRSCDTCGHSLSGADPSRTRCSVPGAPSAPRAGQSRPAGCHSPARSEAPTKQHGHVSG